MAPTPLNTSPLVLSKASFFLGNEHEHDHHNPTIIDIRNQSQFNEELEKNASELEHESIQELNSTKSNSASSSSTSTCSTPGPSNFLALEILEGLCQPKGKMKQIPTVVLYDDKGLQIYDEITYLEEYYLVQEEIDILQKFSEDIVALIPDNSVVVELGSGSLRKTRLLLDALDQKRKGISYYALDLMRDELTKSLVNLGDYTNVKTAGLWGTYDEGMEIVHSFPKNIPKTILWLGSSIGNLTRTDAKNFIESYRDVLNAGDNWLIGIDRRNSPEDIKLAYDDPTSVTRAFIMNGLDHVNEIIGQMDFINPQNFDYYGRYNDELGRYEAYYIALVSQQLKLDYNGKAYEIEIEKGELINVEYSYKWSPEESAQLFRETKMKRIERWESPSSRYDLHMLQKVPFYFDKFSSYTSIPTENEWKELWNAWNYVTTEMIRGPEMLMDQPIELRHPFLFYLGHIPTFLDIYLTKAFDEPLTEPSYFASIFERGIDPDVDEPSNCHPHSVVPTTWPSQSEIIQFRDKVYNKLVDCLRNKTLTRRAGRILSLAFEHQAMHLETVFHMFIQSNHTIPPSVTMPTPKTSLAPSSWIHINPKDLSDEILAIGIDDAESNDWKFPNDLKKNFGWDNENPRIVKNDLLPYYIQSRPVTNGEYFEYLKSKGPIQNEEIPKSWYFPDGKGPYIRSIYGPISMELAKDWAISVSQDEAKKYAEWIGDGAVLPTEHQLSVALKLANNRCADGNYGFTNWIPLISQNEGITSAGSVWEWTNTEFQPLSDEFRPSELYPGYSKDFFDGKHFVALGGSWATHPKIARRKSFRNWYQHNYGYAFVGFRLIKLAV